MVACTRVEAGEAEGREGGNGKHSLILSTTQQDDSYFESSDFKVFLRV